MEKLMIGIDLCDVYTQAAVVGRETAWSLPTVICRKKSAEEWHIGEDAYRYTLLGEGVIVDKLLSLTAKDGTATIQGVKYRGMELLGIFLEKLLTMITEECGNGEICQLVIAVNNMEMRILDGLVTCAGALGVSEDRLHITGHTECFVYYVLSQRRDIWGGQVGMFSLSDEDLRYYELKVSRNARRITAWAEYEELEESFSLNVLDTAPGARMADRILCACADRFMKKKLFSSVFLAGKGFAKTDWAPGFMKQVCNRRRVFAEPALFARGAALKAEDYLHEKTSVPFVCLCEGKIKSTVTIEVLRRGVKVQTPLIQAGESWYEARSVLEVILDGQDYVEFAIAPEQEPKQKRLVRIPLEGFPSRPDKASRIRIALGFLDEKTMVIKIVDRGFGELFPRTDASVRQEVMI